MIKKVCNGGEGLEGEKSLSTNPSSTWIPTKRKHFTIHEHRSISHYDSTDWLAFLWSYPVHHRCRFYEPGRECYATGNVTQLPCQGQESIVVPGCTIRGGQRALIRTYSRTMAATMPLPSP